MRLYKLAIDGHLRPRLATVAIEDVSSAEIIRLHHGLRATPYMANRVLAVASKLMNWAAQHGYRGAHSNPCDGVEKFPEAARSRYLTPSELLRLGAALRIAARYETISPAAIAALKLLLLTGARVSEILSLRWAEVDLAGGALRLSDSKTGAKTIVLNEPALDVLRGWPHYARSPYVFPGEGRGERKGLHRVSLADPWAWMKKRARLRDVRVHDLRHSFASVSVSNGQTLPMIGALLGHSQPATTQRYAHLMDDPLRAASAATGATIATALERRAR
ncbi:MAG: site-specific integrase [Acidobacteriota bacterium]|nr:site-specific integrase [Acidobacteriota bacterium]MDQ3417233.1 site-specific integrase [Acidobacteriota bacterium]